MTQQPIEPAIQRIQRKSGLQLSHGGLRRRIISPTLKELEIRGGERVVVKSLPRVQCDSGPVVGDCFREILSSGRA